MTKVYFTFVTQHKELEKEATKNYGRKLKGGQLSNKEIRASS